MADEKNEMPDMAASELNETQIGEVNGGARLVGYRNESDVILRKHVGDKVRFLPEEKWMGDPVDGTVLAVSIETNVVGGYSTNPTLLYRARYTVCSLEDGTQYDIYDQQLWS